MASVTLLSSAANLSRPMRGEEKVEDDAGMVEMEGLRGLSSILAPMLTPSLAVALPPRMLVTALSFARWLTACSASVDEERRGRDGAGAASGENIGLGFSSSGVGAVSRLRREKRDGTVLACVLSVWAVL